MGVFFSLSVLCSISSLSFAPLPNLNQRKIVTKALNANIPTSVQDPILYSGPSEEGKRNGAAIPEQLLIAIVPLLAKPVAVAFLNLIVSNRYAKNGITAAFVDAIKKTAAILPIRDDSTARTK